MVKAMRERTKRWSPAQAWLAGLAATAILGFAGYVAIGATKAYSTADAVCKLEPKVDDQQKQSADIRERMARIEANTDSIVHELRKMSHKLDRMDEKQQR